MCVAPYSDFYLEDVDVLATFSPGARASSRDPMGPRDQETQGHGRCVGFLQLPSVQAAGERTETTGETGLKV